MKKHNIQIKWEIFSISDSMYKRIKKDNKYRELFMMVCLNNYLTKEEKEWWMDNLILVNDLDDIEEKNKIENQLYNILKKQREDLVKVIMKYL